MKTLELHYPMIQFLIIWDIEYEKLLIYLQPQLTGYRAFRAKLQAHTNRAFCDWLKRDVSEFGLTAKNLIYQWRG